MSRLSDARTALDDFEKTKPGAYESQYQSQMDTVLGKMNDIGEFDYDPDADTAYKQYKSQYTQRARKANTNAQAEAAAQTGGYANSYGTQAGQNAYNNTMAGLDNVLDNLYNRSLGEYNAKKSGLQTELAGLQQADNNARSIYQQNLSNWYDQLNYLQNEYNSAYNEEQQKTANTINAVTGAAQVGASALPWIIKGILALL